jgi:hypothetical protein
MEDHMSSWHRAGTTVLVGLLAAACSSGDGGSGTTGRIITLKTQLNIQDDLTQSKTNALGWSITISKAYLSVGALYYFTGDPVLSQCLQAKSTRQSALAWIGDMLVKPAYAHPGHYIEGAAMGQMVGATTIDLLGSSVALPDGNGVTGMTNSAEFTWQAPPAGDLAPSLNGHVILSQGTATKGTVTIPFIAKADATEVVDGDNKVEVAGCSFGAVPGQVGVDMDGDGTVTLTLVPSVWFDEVDFSYVAPGAVGAPTPDANGVVDIAGTLAWAGFVRGVKKGTAYLFSYSK